MGLDPVAFDIETTGLNDEAEITVIGFAHDLGESLVLNTAGRPADPKRLATAIDDDSTGTIQVEVVDDERALLKAVTQFASAQLDGDRHYLTAYNGETWNGGFDLPFCRTKFHQHGMEWPFGDLAYADMMQIADRFETDGQQDLVGVYDALIGKDTCDPFEESANAVHAFKTGDWIPLLRHNLADVQRTRALARLAGRYVPKSDFNMKNLEPPSH